MKPFQLLLLLLTLTYLTRQNRNIYDLSSLTEQDLDRDDLIEVEQSSKNRTVNPNIIPNYYVIRSIHKEKKYAYMQMQSLFKNVVSLLIKNRIIPDQDSLVKSRIKPQFLSKKRSWTFSTIFVIFGNEQELDKCYNHFSRMRIQLLSTKPSINFLNEKVVALEVFNSAKQKLTKQLQRFSNFQIKEVVQIEIKGSQVENSDILEMQLEEEFNQSEQVINQQQIITGSLETDKPPLQMKILFRVGRYNDDQEQESYDNTNEAESDDEDEELSNESDASL